jgi:hypothetical protein
LATHLAQKKVIQNGVNIQDGDFTFSHQSVWALYFHHFQSYKLQILNSDRKLYNNKWHVFFDKLSISSGIELELGPSRIKGFFIVLSIQNLKFVGLKMAKIQGSDGLMGKRETSILNIDSILNKFFPGQLRCWSACYNNFKMGLNVEFGWEKKKTQ